MSDLPQDTMPNQAVDDANHAPMLGILQELNQIAVASNETRDENEYLKRIAEILRHTTQVDHVGITIVRDDGEKATVVAEAPLSGAIGQEVDIKGVEFAQMRQNQQPVLIHHTQQSDILTPATRQVLNNLGIAHLLIIPLFNAQAELIGTIGLDLYDEEARFTPLMQQTAQTMSAQIATGLQKLRLLNDSRRQLDQMQIVNIFGQSLQARLTTGEILEKALMYTREITDFDYLAFVQYKNDAFFRLPHYADGKEQPADASVPLAPTEQARLRATLQTQQTIIVQDYEHHTPRFDYPLFDTYRSLILLPVTAQIAWIGVVEIASRRAYSYRLSDIASLEQMTNLFGTALLNAQAYAQSQRTAQNRALTNDIALQLQQQSDVNAMLDITVRELGKRLKARRARIRLGIGESKER